MLISRVSNKVLHFNYIALAMATSLASCYRAEVDLHLVAALAEGVAAERLAEMSGRHAKDHLQLAETG